ncbi:uncharacterized protein PITG_17510 [Phytophthora infestans T30-4]|uniref:Uncharacterized protein n=1 Tax=Phytophthora infestans (strain T30-4) TaxID=403677 RepID=D0NWG2_PHYIT|nr:uncharacterized protein PITG_17510 [Phytophthora infestans T30-4]EEY67018.1 hypothetical protein PITG_17510 [Phytophthora infestans T30-4]|eukprot:XP_002896572.1 hypothetical protein PITG_17510 [Phytophthora infestans T30-4]
MSSCSPLQLSASFKRYYAQLRHPTFAPANTPLHVAALNNDYNRVHRLLTEGGGDPNITDQTGCTALNHAALLGNAKICELLITTGAIINDAAHDGSTPLHKAAQGGRTHIVELLLREGADPFAKGENAYTIASHRNHVQVAMLLYPYSVLPEEKCLE